MRAGSQSKSQSQSQSRGLDGGWRHRLMYAGSVITGFRNAWTRASRAVQVVEALPPRPHTTGVLNKIRIHIHIHIHILYTQTFHSFSSFRNFIRTRIAANAQMIDSRFTLFPCINNFNMTCTRIFYTHMVIDRLVGLFAPEIR